MSIERLSRSNDQVTSNGSALVMVGSFAPVHYGHLDVMKAAERVVRQRIGQVDAAVFAPNSDSYVSTKLNDIHGDWDFESRVTEFDDLDSDLDAPAFVDDITGLTPPSKSISEAVIQTVSHRFGMLARQAILVVGSDQVASMRPHLKHNRAVCVVRPNHEEQAYKVMQEDWLQEAVYRGRYIFTNQEDPYLVVSSTAVRQSLVDIRGYAL